jgi:hypothetical protein
MRDPATLGTRTGQRATAVLTLPGSLRDAFDRGGIYLFSRAFFEDRPRGLTGPGRFRFVVQPVIATLLGIRKAERWAEDGKLKVRGYLSVFYLDQGELSTLIVAPI